jgi:regulator of sigma E protease
METILATVLVIGVLIFVHELGHFLTAKWYGVGVEAFSLGFPPRLFHKQVGETDYRISIIPLGGYVKLMGENPNDEVPPELLHKSFSHRSIGQRIAIVAAGPLFNLLFAVVAFSLVFAFTGIPHFTTEIGGVHANSPAAEAGLQSGDRVLSINQEPVQRWDELAGLIRKSGPQPLELKVQRGDQQFNLTLVPRAMETSNIYGEKVSAYIIGVSASEKYEIERVDPVMSFWRGITYTGKVIEVTVLSAYKLIIRQVPLDTLGGPIMIAKVAGKQAEMGVSYLVHFMAVLSVNLAMLNLFPIPMLDGGHLLFFGLEAIRGKPVAIKHREIAQSIGLMLILTLMFFVFYNDIQRLMGPPQP